MKSTHSLILLLCCAALIACGDDDGGTSYHPYPGADAGGARADEPEREPGDMYDYVGTNPFVLADSDPFSTFASDVDTASYDIFVRDVEDGLLPARDSVRLEEYVNFFPYDYEAPEPGAAVPFAIELSASEHVMGRDLVQMRVGIQAASPPEFNKLPTNLVFLVDVSGSMSDPDKLPLAQEVIRQSLSALEQNDTVSIVSYASDTRVRLEPTAAFQRDTILAAVDALSAAGSTAGSRGIQLAYEQAEAGFLEGGFNHVVLCTDGDFNIGISDPDELVALIEEERRGGVTLTALGFGRGNLNDAMMERVSNAGNGFYSVITSAEHAGRYARDALLHTIEVVARDLKIQVEFNPALVRAYRLLGFENRAIADNDFRNDVVDAGEIGSGHRVTALYELVLTGHEIPMPEGAPEPDLGEESDVVADIDPADLAVVRVRWKDRDASEEDAAHEVSATLAPEVVTETAGDDAAWAAAIAAFAEILKESPFADVADLDVIAPIVAAQASRDDDRGRFAVLFEEALRLLGR